MGSARNKAAQPARFLSGATLQLQVTEVLLLPQLGLDHILLLHREALRLGDLQQLLKIERLLQPQRQFGLLTCMGEKGVELCERQETT